jgi:hypothetical protein
MKMQFLSSTIPALMIAWSTMSLTALAQGPLPARYTPARPTISPYFAYSAINTTGLPNYYTYVQPFQQTQYTTAARRDLVAPNSYDSRVSLTERSIEELLDRRLSQRLTTGGGAPATAATFQNYSHFYPRPTAGRR